MHRLSLCAVPLMLATVLCHGDDKAKPAQGANDWPQWRGSGRDAKSPEKGLLQEWPKDGPKLIWKAEGLGENFVTPTVAAGRIFVMGNEPERARRGYVIDLAEGTPRPVTPEGRRRGMLSPDGRFLLARTGEGDWTLYSLEQGSPRAAIGLRPAEEPTQWSDDSRTIYVHGADRLEPGETTFTTKLFRLDPWTGARELWKEISPASTTTGGGIGNVLFAAGGRICVYTRYRHSSELFVVEGLE